MTQLEDELREYIRENIMSPTTALLIKEVAIPILIEYLKRKDKKAASELVEEISNNTDIIKHLSKDRKKDLVDGLTDVISELLGGLIGEKDK